MAEQENHFTVFIRLPFNRGDFVDPLPVAWSATKERELWDVISRQSKGNEIDWHHLAEQFQVTQQFLLQQAAWLYERQLSQVRAQMRRMGNRQSATASPAPSSAAASMVGAQTSSKRPAGITSRGPSRLSTQIPTSTTSADTSVPNTPARSRTSLPLKPNPPTTAIGGTRGQSTSSRPLSRKPSKDEPSSRTHSRRGSIQQQQLLTRSPGEFGSRSADLSSSFEDDAASRPVHRRPNSISGPRRTSSIRKSQTTRGPVLGVHQLQEAQEEDEDDPAFLPFANTASKGDSSTTAPSDPSATLRGGLSQPSTTSTSSTATATAVATATATTTRPPIQRNHTSERVRPVSQTSTGKTKDQPAQGPSQTQIQPQAQLHRQSEPQRQLTSSTSSLSSNNSPYPPTTLAHRPQSMTTTTTTTTTTSRSPSTNQPNLPTPLSPRQQAALATAAGLSPRRRALNNHPQSSHTHGHGHGHAMANALSHGYTGSESSPSMGSSFSDLDDASVTQSALEEALLSNMNALGGTVGTVGGGSTTGNTGNGGGAGGGGGGGGGGLGSRVSGISQALRSRYFDARGSPGNPAG